MATCTRCRSFTCNGGCSGGKCRTCGNYSCRGNCSIPQRQTQYTSKPIGLLRCAVCGSTYSSIHTSSECKGNVDKQRRRR